MPVTLVTRLGPLERTALNVTGGYVVLAVVLLLSAWLVRAAGYPELAARLPWYLSRAAGITAYLLLTATTVLGLAISTRIANRWLDRSQVFVLHEHLAWLGLVVTGLHLGGLVADSYVSFGVTDLLVPFAAPYRPVAVALGSVTLYLSAILTVSFYVRARIGRRAWRRLHTASFAAYTLATAHGILAGSSSVAPWMQWLYLASGGVVLLLTNYRLLLTRGTPAQRPRRATSSLGGAAGAGS